MLAPPSRQSHILPPGHANRSPRIPPACRPCWRRPTGKALSHRLATPTGRPEFRPAAAHVGAALLSKPYPTAWPRQQGAPNLARRPPMLAPPSRQNLIPPPGPANRAPRIPPACRPCWRRPAAHVGAGPPAKPYPTAWPRQQGVPNPAYRPPMLAPALAGGRRL